MIGMIRRILGVSGKYQGRIYGDMGFSFLKGLLMKVPIILTYFIVTAFIDGTLTKNTALYEAISTFLFDLSLHCFIQFRPFFIHIVHLNSDLCEHSRTLIILPIIPQSALLFNPVYKKREQP